MNPTRSAAPNAGTPAAMDPAAALAASYRRIRRLTERLCETLSAEDCAVQSMADASPAKWHMAHTTWFFETMVLEQAIEGYRTFMPELRVLFNS